MKKTLSTLLLILWIIIGNFAVAQTDFEIEVKQAIADYEAEKYAEALPIFEKYKAVILENLKGNKAEQINFLNVLADCYEKTGQTEKYEIVISYITELQKQTGTTQNNTNQSGQIPTEAIQAYQKAEQYKVEGNYNEAIEYYQQAISIHKEKVGSQDADYATLINNLAFLFIKQGLYTKAEPLYLEAKAIYEKTLGREHPDYATSCNNLAELYSKQGLYDKAEPLYLEAKAIFEKTLGREHPDYAASLNNLAGLYIRQGLYDKAEPLYLEALEIGKVTLGNKHPIYVHILKNLLTIYQKTNNSEKEKRILAEIESLSK